MRVHGLEGVRVIDASAMRYVTNGNIYAPTMMLAEKSADMILGNTPLAAINEPYYVHRMAEGSSARYGRDGGGESGGGSEPAAAEASAAAAPAE
jgi:choline dehydrogenase